jgi:hypothetical protein
MKQVWETRNAYFISGNLMGGGHLRTVYVDERVILKQALKK